MASNVWGFQLQRIRSPSSLRSKILFSFCATTSWTCSSVNDLPFELAFLTSSSAFAQRSESNFNPIVSGWCRRMKLRYLLILVRRLFMGSSLTESSTFVATLHEHSVDGLDRMRGTQKSKPEWPIHEWNNLELNSSSFVLPSVFVCLACLHLFVTRHEKQAGDVLIAMKIWSITCANKTPKRERRPYRLLHRKIYSFQNPQCP